MIIKWPEPSRKDTLQVDLRACLDAIAELIGDVADLPGGRESLLFVNGFPHPFDPDHLDPDQDVSGFRVYIGWNYDTEYPGKSARGYLFRFDGICSFPWSVRPDSPMEHVSWAEGVTDMLRNLEKRLGVLAEEYEKKRAAIKSAALHFDKSSH